MKKFALAICALLFVVGCAKKRVAEDSSNEVKVTPTPIATEQQAPEPQQEVIQEEEVQQQETTQETEEQEPTPAPEAKKSIESGTIVGKVYFDYNKYNIRSDMQNAVRNAADEANDYKNYSVVVEGNTDEFGTDEYNLALGNRRALAIKRALVNLGNVDASNIKTISLGKSKPVCQQKTSACYQENRRGDIKLVQ